MNTHSFKRTRACTLPYGVLVVLLALGACAAPAQPEQQPSAEQPASLEQAVTQVPVAPAEPTVTQAPAAEPTATQTLAAEPTVTQAPAAEPTATQAHPTPAGAVLTFWTPALSEDDIERVQERLDAFEHDTRIEIAWHSAPVEYYEELASALKDNDFPDLAALPLPVPADIAATLGEGRPWLLCDSRLAVALKRTRYPDEAAALLQHLTSEESVCEESACEESACNEGLPITYVPYDTPLPPPPEIIGDAEYVPGDEVIVGGVKDLQEQLIEVGATINIARAVVLTWNDETTYMAPVGPPLTQDPSCASENDWKAQATETGITFAMIVVPQGVYDSEAGLYLDPGAYLLREFLVVKGDSEQWVVRFIDSAGETRGEVAETEEALSFDPQILRGLLSAGIFIGSNKCSHCHWWDGCHKHSC